METSFKKLKGSKVYIEKNADPCGVIVDVLIDTKIHKAVALKIKTLSLIPLCKITDLCNICNISQKKITLKQNFLLKKSFQDTPLSSLNQFFDYRFKKINFKDIYFDSETGLLSDIVVSKNILSENYRIPINKISLKDNTIIEIR